MPKILSASLNSIIIIIISLLFGSHYMKPPASVGGSLSLSLKFGERTSVSKQNYWSVFKMKAYPFLPRLTGGVGGRAWQRYVGTSESTWLACKGMAAFRTNRMFIQANQSRLFFLHWKYSEPTLVPYLLFLSCFSFSSMYNTVEGLCLRLTGWHSPFLYIIIIYSFISLFHALFLSESLWIVTDLLIHSIRIPWTFRDEHRGESFCTAAKPATMMISIYYLLNGVFAQFNGICSV